MTTLDHPELAKEYEAAFGSPVTALTVHQLWWLTKFAKHARGRCRSNAAFNNWMNRNFPHARFTEVPKIGARGPYKGLQITVGNESVAGEQDNE